jgi:hypothetical protein
MEAGLEPKKYDNHLKRAAGMTALIYKDVGLHPRAQQQIDETFK